MHYLLTKVAGASVSLVSIPPGADISQAVTMPVSAIKTQTQLDELIEAHRMPWGQAEAALRAAPLPSEKVRWGMVDVQNLSFRALKTIR